MMNRLALAACLFAVGASSLANGAEPGQFDWEEFSKRIKASETVSPLGPNMFGDGVSLSNGALSFSATDLSVPGNNSLPVAFSRSYTVFNRKDYPSDGMLADWAVDAPNISGVFAPDWLSSVPTSPGTRCSNTLGPPLATPAVGIKTSDFWQGVNLNIPGVDSGELLAVNSAATKPTDGATYRWVTNGQVHFSCLSNIKNGNGTVEGFLAVGPDGTRYWFDWQAQFTEAPVKKMRIDTAGASPVEQSVPRKKNVLYATRVEDRFGNRVEYTYSNAWNQPGKLTHIKGFDAGASTPSRTITITYSGNYVSQVTDGTRKRAYGYGDTSSGRKTLTAVTPLDGTTPVTAEAWVINFSDFTNAEIKYDESTGGEIPRSCRINQEPIDAHVPRVGTITHPSGAIGRFSVDLREHGRSNVPINCDGVTTTGAPGTAIGNNEIDDVNLYATKAYSFTLKQKRVTGPGLLPADWNYSYEPGFSAFMNAAMGVTGAYPVCRPLNDPACSAREPCIPACAGLSRTMIIGPDGRWERHTHGNSYLYNEGKLLKVERGGGPSNILSTVTHTYDFSLTDQQFPARFGTSQRSADDGFASTYHRPLLESVTSQQEHTFSWSVGADCVGFLRCFNAFAEPTTVVRSSSLGYARTDRMEHDHNTSKWVIGQVQRLTQGGVVAAELTYDPVTASQLTYKDFGLLRQTLTYNPDGTVATVKDGNNKITTLASWKAGIPQSITYPATPEATSGSTKSAVVNSLGWIQSVTDELGFTTTYGYDLMGRLQSILYPTGDSTAWNTTTLAFEKVATAEYGIPANHWRHTISTGNARKISYFDARWRPLVTREYDTADVAATQRFQRFTYDHDGQVTFASYLGTTDALTSGTFTFYDAIGRATSTVQDSEFGPSEPITTTTSYLPGFITSTTNPRGEVTLTSYMAYDQPTMDWPHIIDQPEGQRTTIARDTWGKPTSLTRSGGGLSVTRSYVYGDAQQLCYSTEPETGTTVFGYDAVGNVLWSTAGQPTPADCAAARAGATNKVVRTYDGRNRLSTLIFPDNRGNQSWTYYQDGLPAQIATDNVAGGEQVVNAYTYNKRRLLTGESMTQPNASAWSLGYAYDSNAALAGTTYPKNNYISYAPNALGQATRAGPYATGVQYWPNGAIKQFTYGNGIVHTMLQNARQLPARSSDIGGGTAMDLAYTYDKNTNVASITDYVDGRQTRSMTYDALDRLKTTTSVMFGGDNVASYTYNALDDITTLRVGGHRDHTYVYDGATRRLMNVKNTAGLATVVGLDYDVRGNLKQKNGQLYDFTFGNRLRSATNQETYRYDGHGRRVRASSATGNILSMYGQDGVLRRQEDWRTGKLTDYIYLGGSLVARVSNAPTLAAPTLTAPGYNTSGSYTVQWSAVTSANAYQLEEQVDGGIWQQVYAGAAQSKAISGKTGGAYGYRARGCLAAVCGSWSAVATVAVQLPPVLAPSLSVPATAVNGNFTVSWGTVATATSYTLEQSANGGAWTVSYTGAAQSKAFTNIGAGSFSYRVKACNPAGCGDLSGTGTTQALYPPGTATAPSVPAQSTNGSFTVTWAAVATATNYRLQESVNAGTWTQIQDATATSRALSGKAAGNYAYRVIACNTAGCGAASAAASVEITLPPTAAPSVSAPASAPGGNYTVIWTSVATATSYRLEESSNGGGWVQVQDANALSKTYAGKAAGVHSYRARGCNLAGCGGYSNVGAVDVPPPAPATPTNPRATYSYMDGIGMHYVFRWNASSSATHYEANGSLSYSGPNLVASRTYSGEHVPSRSFYVRACNTGGCSAWTDPVTASADPPASAPGITTPAQSFNGSFTVSWSTVATATAYRLEESANSAAWTLIQNAAATSLAIADKGTGSYSYRTMACNASGCGPYSAAVSTQVTLPPAGAPELSAPASAPGGSFTVSWSGVAGATSYRLEESANGAGWTLIQHTASASRGISGKPAGNYSYRAQACNGAGCGGYSNTASVNVPTPPPVTPGIPGNPRATHTYLDGIGTRYVFRWDASVNATHYEADGSLSYSGPNLVASRTYAGGHVASRNFRVRACNANGCSAWSAAVTATPQ